MVVMTAVFLIIGVWIYLSVIYLLGFRPGPTVRDTGVARIIACERAPVHLWLIHECEADVLWQEGPASKRRGDQGKGTGVVRTQVTSTRHLEGQVDVVERLWASRHDSDWMAVPADYPVSDDKALFFVIMMSCLGMGVVGWLVGYKLAELLPEPPDRRRLTLRMSSLDERGQPRVMRTRPRRRPKKPRRR